MTVMAIGMRDSAPGPMARAGGMAAAIVDSDVIKMGRRRLGQRLVVGWVACALLRAMRRGDKMNPGVIGLIVVALFSGMGEGQAQMSEKIVKSEDEWRQLLTPEQFQICRKKGTERAFTGRYLSQHESGTYYCACCGNPLFRSDEKFESGTGWPSFWQPISPAAIRTEDDVSWFMRRTEVLCRRCDGHLGHVFEDGPEPTGLRYCLNSAALQFMKAGQPPPHLVE